MLHATNYSFSIELSIKLLRLLFNFYQQWQSLTSPKGSNTNEQVQLIRFQL